MARSEARSRTKLLNADGSSMATGCGAVFLLLFFGCFLAFGAGMGWNLFAAPFLELRQAMTHWTKTSCVIESSRVVVVDGDDSDTYKVEITYRYKVGDTLHRSSRYDFTTGSDSSSSDKEAIVARHAPGSETSCLYNPAAPDQAVLVPGLRLGFFPLLIALFLIIGLCGVHLALRSLPLFSFPAAFLARLLVARSDPAAVLADSVPPQTRIIRVPSARLPEVRCLWHFSGLLVWGTLAAAALWGATDLWRLAGQPEIPLFSIAVIFAVITLWHLFGVHRQFLAFLRAPLPAAALSPDPVPAGTPVTFHWRLSHVPSHFTGLVLRQVAKEITIYQEGTTTRTDTKVVFTGELVSLGFAGSEPEPALQGARQVTFSRPSVSTGNSQFRWEIQLVLHSSLPNGGDTYPYEVDVR